VVKKKKEENNAELNLKISFVEEESPRSLSA